MGRILAIDYGDRRVGLAISDETATVASTALDTIDRKTRPRGWSLEQELDRLVREREIEEVVVGLPVNMDGSRGESVRKVIDFVQALEQLLPVKVSTWDERLTSVAAQRVRAELNLPLKKRREKGKLDSLAAVILLQNYLNWRAGRAICPGPEEE